MFAPFPTMLCSAIIFTLTHTHSHTHIHTHTHTHKHTVLQSLQQLIRLDVRESVHRDKTMKITKCTI
jgi:bifunctional ADP-heptose synthase (sugar kinase/adenylyltransferase)